MSKVLDVLYEAILQFVQHPVQRLIDCSPADMLAIGVLQEVCDAFEGVLAILCCNENAVTAVLR